MKKNILYIFQEITPYLPESPMAEIGRYLPQKIQEKGNQIRVFMPRYGLVKERRNQLHEVIRLSGMNIVVNDMDHSLVIKVASIQSARMQVYFIDNEDYFQRKALFYDENNEFFEDNDERTIFFTRGVMETIKKLRWKPDIIHINGWLSALVPMYLQKLYSDDPIFNDTKVVVSLYNDEFDEKFQSGMKKKIKMDGITNDDLKPMDKNNYQGLMKLAIKYSDAVIAAQENINPSLIKYAKSKNKLFLDFIKEEDYYDQYDEFYSEVLNVTSDIK